MFAVDAVGEDRGKIVTGNVSHAYGKSVDNLSSDLV